MVDINDLNIEIHMISCKKHGITTEQYETALRKEFGNTYPLSFTFCRDNDGIDTMAVKKIKYPPNITDNEQNDIHHRILKTFNSLLS